jgi:pyruvate, water dikinase
VVAGSAAVLDLRVIRGSDAGRVGPKMARLGQLAADGWRVPDGYAITASALDGWLPATARAELERIFTGTRGNAAAPDAAGGPRPSLDLGRVAAQARALIEAQPLPSWLADAVAEAHQRLTDRLAMRPAGRSADFGGAGAAPPSAPGGTGAAGQSAGPGTPGAPEGPLVAVRSSAISEDGAGASFAGQYETYLGVRGVDSVLEHIRKCWASGYSAHALEYRRRFGGAGPLRTNDLAVGVVELVDARSAGVAFTLDPVTGDRGTLVVEGNWGFGESVVSGHVTPDHWTVDRESGQLLTARTSAKRAWAAFSAAAGRVVLEPPPDDLVWQPCLSEQEVRYICEQAVRIEAAQGGVPLDVEWAVARDLPFPESVYFLQHRPETTWTGAPPAKPAEAVDPAGPAGPAGPAEQPKPAKAFDPVQYALRNVFKVPGI